MKIQPLLQLFFFFSSSSSSFSFFLLYLHENALLFFSSRLSFCSMFSFFNLFFLLFCYELVLPSACSFSCLHRSVRVSYFLRIPLDVVREILSYLPASALITVAVCNREMYKVCSCCFRAFWPPFGRCLGRFGKGDIFLIFFF